MGEMLISKELYGWITIAMVVVALRDPEVPVMVTKVRMGVAELLAVSVSVLLVVVGFANQYADTPLGRADVMARFTLPVNPA